MRMRGVRRRRATNGSRNERGFGVIEVMIVALLLVVAIVGWGLVSIKATIATRAAQTNLTVRMAASQVINSTLPASVGGSVAPAPAVTGFSDLVMVDPKTGTISPVGDAPPPSSAMFIRRQWQLQIGSSGAKVFSVSAVLVDGADGEPVAGPLGADYHFNKVLR